MAFPIHRLFPIRATAQVLAIALSAGASARDRSDHERAREAVVAGQILPLRTVMERLEREKAGQVLEIELESEDRRWIYEVKLLQSDGRLMRLEIDAGTGEVISRRLRPQSQHQGEPR